MAADVTAAVAGSPRLQHDVAASLVGPFVMIVGDELPHSRPKVVLAEEDDAIETLLLDRPDKSLCMGIGELGPKGPVFSEEVIDGVGLTLCEPGGEQDLEQAQRRDVDPAGSIA